MILLHIETSTAVCSAAISENGICLAQKINTEGQNHAKLLNQFVDELLQGLRAEGKTIDAVALSQGPGSYTGLRIGTATAKGICFGLSIPLIAVDTLQLMAYAARKQMEHVANYLLCPMIDARRMEVYNALYTPQLELTEAIKPHIITEEAFAEELSRQKICFFGDGAAKCKSVITHPNAIFIDNIYPEAAEMVGLAEAKFRAKAFVDVAYFEPLYLKEFQTTASKKNPF